jgi:alkane 1-monooxygenase
MLWFCLPFLFLQLAWLCLTSWASLALPSLVVVFLIGETVSGNGRGRIAVAGRRLYRWLPRLFVPLQLGAVVAALLLVSDPMLSTWRFVTLVLTIGAISGIFGMLSAHELIHSRTAFDRTLGLAMLAGVSYMHFRISHLRGHHRLAATSEDPATARRGESVYRFALRSAIGQYRQAWQFEYHRAKTRRRPLFANRMLAYLAATAILYMGAGSVAGLRGLSFLALQSLLAVFILEAFNYVAHYGLERPRRPDGRYEALAAKHSWNTARRFSNWSLFNAGAHSHHHAQPSRPYEMLLPCHGAPELPMGYAGCILLSLVPPLWRGVMDKRIPASIGVDFVPMPCASAGHLARFRRPDSPVLKISSPPA